MLQGYALQHRGRHLREGLEFLQSLAGLNIVGGDINTASPPHDCSRIAAFLAATVGLEILSLICYSKKLIQEKLIFFSKTLNQFRFSLLPK